MAKKGKPKGSDTIGKPIPEIKDFVEPTDLPMLRMFVVCEFLVRDFRNMPSIINVFDEFKAKNFPTSFNVNVFAQLNCPEGSHNIKIVMVGIDKKAVSLINQEFVVGLEVIRNFAITITIRAGQAGIFNFYLYIDDKLIGATVLRVKLMTEEGD